MAAAAHINQLRCQRLIRQGLCGYKARECVAEQVGVLAVIEPELELVKITVKVLLADLME